MNEHISLLRPNEWAQIPPEYIWFAIDLCGSQYAYTEEPSYFPTGTVWVHDGEELFLGMGPKCPGWQTSLQQRPEPTQPEIKEIGAAALNQILANEGFRPTTPPALPVSIVRVSTAEFDRIAADFGLRVRDCGTYRDAAMYNPGGFVSIVFVCDVPTATEFDDTGIELLVRTYEKIKIT